jgi:glutathione peroxidase
MEIRQKILKTIYPLLMKMRKRKALAHSSYNKEDVEAPRSFYSLSARLSNGQPFSFSSLKGKYVMIVNVASRCGYTGQYEDLQRLYETFNNRLAVLGFPSNDFKGQEPGSDEVISQFCKLNYGVTFPVFEKQPVLKPNQREVYQWLTDAAKNGWNSEDPSWNFCKYIIGPNGQLLAFFPSAVSPNDEKILSFFHPA